MTVESLKIFFDWGGVILLCLTFALAAGALITGNAINDRQAERLRQFDKQLTEAKTKLGEQEVLAANAQKDLAGLQKEASDSKAAQQKVEVELAHATTELSSKQAELEESQRRTAEAQRDAAAAQLAFKKYVEGKMQPRGIPPDEVFLKPFNTKPALKPLKLVILYQRGQQETGMFASALSSMLGHTNWVPEQPKGVDNLLEIRGATVLTEIIVVTNGKEQRWSDITRSEIALLQALSSLNRPMHQSYDEDLPNGTVQILIAPRLYCWQTKRC